MNTEPNDYSKFELFDKTMLYLDGACKICGYQKDLYGQANHQEKCPGEIIDGVYFSVEHKEEYDDFTNTGFGSTAKEALEVCAVSHMSHGRGMMTLVYDIDECTKEVEALSKIKTKEYALKSRKQLLDNQLEILNGEKNDLTPEAFSRRRDKLMADYDLACEKYKG